MPISRTLTSELRDDARVRLPAAVVHTVTERRRPAPARPATPQRRRRARAPRTVGALVAAAAITLVTAPVAEAISAVIGR